MNKQRINSFSYKNISIITDFGCNRNCWYCVWKNHSLNFQKKIETNWKKVEEFLIKYNRLNKVSISGGGDPLYDYNKNCQWWNSLFSICNKIEMKIDIHTREKIYDDGFWQQINRCVFSCDKLENTDIDFFNYVSKLAFLRLACVITKDTTENQIDTLISFATKNNIELTFKQLHGFSDDNNFNKFKKIYLNSFFLEDGDYNIYFMPNNIEYDRFL